MKLIVALLLTLFSTVLALAQVKPDGEKENLAGPVHTVRQEFAPLSDEYGRRLNGPRTPRRLDTFDTVGSLTETRHYDKVGGVTSRTIASFSAAGKKSESSSYKRGDKLSSKSVYTLDDNGRLAQIDSYDDKNAITTRTFYSYDAAGKCTEKRREEKGETDVVTSYKYDGRGRLTEKETVNREGESVSKTTYTYSEDVTRIEYLIYKDKTVASKTVRINNSRERKTEIGLFKANGTLSWKWTFGYDDRLNVIKEEFNNDLLLYKGEYQYEFDQQGNWVKRTSSRWYRVAGKDTLIPEAVEFRTISYYPQPYATVDNKSEPADEPASSALAGGVLQGSAIQRVAPAYPAGAKAAHASGTVIVEATVDEEGNVVKVHTISGSPLLRDESETAARGWKFKPTLLSGVPVKVIGTITFNFNL